MSDYVKQSSSFSSFESDDKWIITQGIEASIINKIHKNGTPLNKWSISINYGIKTGANEAFIIDETTRRKLISEDPKSAEIIRPILRGKDIKRYQSESPHLYLLVVHNGNKQERQPRINVDDYPAIKRHLDRFFAKLEMRDDQGDTPYNLRNCVYMDDFSKPKIFYREIGKTMDACFVKEECYINNKCYVLTGDHLIYLLGVFNSLIFDNVIMKSANTTGGKGKDFLDEIAVPKLDEESYFEFEQIVLQRNRETEPSKQKELDSIINSLVNAAYKLNDEEIKWICGNQ